MIALYLLFTELVKSAAAVYVIEKSLELKIFLFALIVLMVYDISFRAILIAIEFSLVLNIFGLPTGYLVYVLIIVAFFKLYKNIKIS